MINNLMATTVEGLLSNFLYIIIAFLILMLMITIHEAGHYTAGKLLGFKINEFAIGMGPKIYSKKNKKTGEIFSVRALPLGGFCAFEGESEDKETKGAFNSQKPYKRIIVLFAGAFFNFVSAVLIVIFAFTVFGTYMPTVDRLVDNSPAQEAYEVAAAQDDFSHALIAGDTILELNGKKILLQTDLSKYMPLSENGAHTSVLVVRDGKKVLLTDVRKGTYLTEKYDENGNAELDESGAPLMQSASGFGVFLDGASPRYRFSFFESVGRSIPYSLSTATAILKALGELVTGVLGLKDVGGPISTIDITMQVARSGFVNVLYLITLISINLAVFNLLPIPALDGSKIVFTAIEWIRGKPINRTVENYIHLIGLLLLFSFVIIIDVIKLF